MIGAGRCAVGEQHGDPVPAEPAGRELQRCSGFRINPLGIVDQQYQRLLVGVQRQQGKSCGRDKEAIGTCRTLRTAERPFQRQSLPGRKCIQPIEYRGEQIEQTGVGQ